MDWVTALAIVSIVAGVTISVVVLVAVGSIRRSLNEGTLRQAQQLKRLGESVVTLTAEQQAAQLRIQTLSDANRRLSEELAALGERLADGDSLRGPGGSARLLH
jgi:ABC-type lipoprotein release transport system permease subunit